jgi:DNA-binding response OmpR family regulator
MMAALAKILIVDDEPFNVDYLEQLLADLGYQTVSAANGQEALERVAAEAPDLILLDVMMPVMDGFTVCRKLKENEETQLIPIVIMTALGAREDRIKGISAGADDFLTRPVNSRELGARIETALKHKQAIDRKIGQATAEQGQTATRERILRAGLPTVIPSTQRSVFNIFLRESEYWTVVYANTTVRLKDAKGLHYLAYLLQRPGQDVHVFDLLALTDKRPTSSLTTGGYTHMTTEQLAEQHLYVAKSSEAVLAPDVQARATYHRRLRDLQYELDEAERFHDTGRAARLQEEIDFLTRELVTAYGFSGRASHKNAVAERVRKAVTNRIRAALVQIQKAHPSLWRHLFAAIKTGTFCAYRPDKPTTWQS